MGSDDEWYASVEKNLLYEIFSDAMHFYGDITIAIIVG